MVSMITACIFGAQSVQAQNLDLSPIALAFDTIRTDYIEPVDMLAISGSAVTELQKWSKVGDAEWSSCMKPGKPSGPKKFRDMLPLIDAFNCAGYKEKSETDRLAMVNLAIASMVKPLGSLNQWMPLAGNEPDDIQFENKDQTSEPTGTFAEKKALVVTIPNLAVGTATKVRELVADAPLERTGVIILDMRGNTGGLLDEASAVADLFLDNGVIASAVERKNYDKQVVRAQSGAIAGESKIVILTDAKTAAGAEIVASALQDNRRARVVGARTSGADTIQTIIPILPAGYISLTTARIFRSDGRSLAGAPVIPDCEAYGEGAVLVDLAIAVADGNLSTCRAGETAG